jgi:hypothetical protein
MRLRTTLAAVLVPLVPLVALASGCSSTPGSTAGSTPSSASASSAPSGGASHHVSGAGGSPSPSAPHATEFNPPGDIPDNAVFVDHVAPGSRVHFTVPEGWAKSKAGGVATFTDKYNSISIEVRPRSAAPTVASAKKQDVPQLRRSVSAFAAGPVTMVSRQHGHAVHIAYLLDSAPNPVTGKVVRDAAERFEFWHAGQEAILTLTGPQNADNVDPWRTVSDSLQWK